MKSSNKKKRTDFENAWADALKNAESAPSSKVWQGINNELLNADHIRIKGYYKTYKIIAAASISLLLLIGTAFTYYYFSNPTQNQTSITKNNQLLQLEANTLQSPSKNEFITKQEENNLKQNYNNRIQEKNSTSSQIKIDNTNVIANHTLNEDANSNPTQKEANTLLTSNIKTTEQKDRRIIQSADNAFQAVAKEGFEKINRQEIILLDHSQINLPPVLVNKQATPKVAPTPNKTIVLSTKAVKSKNTVRDRSKKFYADLNILTDYFNPNFEVASPQINQVNFTQLNAFTESEVNASLLGQQNSPSASFSYGINMGVKLSGKWIVEGGISYANYNTQSQSNLTVADINKGITLPVTLLNKPLVNDDQLNSTLINLGSVYSVNNSFEFASIPVRAGYVFGINKINLILKAGINTGVFIRNEITANNDSLEPFVNKPGAIDSPFRKVHMNGLLSNEVNYALNQNYSFSVAANYRFALNSLTREGEDISSRPDAYGIGMVLRYHFN